MVTKVPNASNVIVCGDPQGRVVRFEARLALGSLRDSLDISLIDHRRKVGQTRTDYLTRDEIEALRDLLNTYWPKEVK